MTFCHISSMTSGFFQLYSIPNFKFWWLLWRLKQHSTVSKTRQTGLVILFWIKSNILCSYFQESAIHKDFLNLNSPSVFFNYPVFIVWSLNFLIFCGSSSCPLCLVLREKSNILNNLNAEDTFNNCSVILMIYLTLMSVDIKSVNLNLHYWLNEV